MSALTESAKQLIARVLRRKDAAAPASQPSVSETLSEATPPLSIRKAARERGALWRSHRLLTFSVCTNVVLAGILLGTAQLAKTRPQSMIRAKGDLRSQVQAHFSVTELRKDNILFFLQTVLTLRNGITSKGAPFLGTLQGLVSAKIFNEATDDVRRNLTGVQAQEMTRSLIIEEVAGIDLEEEDGRQTGRLSAIVKGTLPIQATKTGFHKPLALPQEYRALVVVDTIPVSNLNPFGYYLVNLREETGADAVRAFDREMAAKNAHARGK